MHKDDGDRISPIQLERNHRGWDGIAHNLSNASFLLAWRLCTSVAKLLARRAAPVAQDSMLVNPTPAQSDCSLARSERLFLTIKVGLSQDFANQGRRFASPASRLGKLTPTLIAARLPRRPAGVGWHFCRMRQLARAQQNSARQRKAPCLDLQQFGLNTTLTSSLAGHIVDA